MTDLDAQPLDALRKQPVQARAWRTVLTVFEATAQILTNDAVAPTTNRVAERAGVSIGTLYQYFPSMEAILEAMIDYERRKVVKQLWALLAEAETSAASPEIYIRRYIRLLAENFSGGTSARRRLLRQGWRLDHTPPVMALTQETAARIHRVFARRAHPDFPPPDPALLWVVTRGTLGALRAAELEQSDLAGSPELIDALETMCVTALRRPAAGPLPAPNARGATDPNSRAPR